MEQDLAQPDAPQGLGLAQEFEDNDEAIRAWDGPLFDRFVQFRHVICGGLAPYGEAALELCPPQLGEKVLDIGCGFGETTIRIADLVGPDGEALGVDAAPRFIEVAEREAADVPNARFAVVDVETATFDETFDMAFSRMGTMFFANPVAALRRVRQALAPGGRLAMAVWRSKAENDWMMRAQEVTERFITKPEEYDEPTCGPGPFSMANADTTSGILKSAGFDEISLRRCDLPIMTGRDVDEAIELAVSLGPAGEILRLAGDSAEQVLPDVRAALHDELADWQGADGVVAPASGWIVTARVPS